VAVIIVKSLQISQTNSFNASHEHREPSSTNNSGRKKAFSNQMWSECNLLPFFSVVYAETVDIENVQEAKI
jgi:hypothetical protein